MHLHIEFELGCTLLGDRRTEYTSPVAHHKVDLLGCYQFGSRDEVAFVLTIFIIDNDDKLARFEIFDSLLDGV